MTLQQHIDELGFAIRREALDTEQLGELLRLLPTADASPGIRQRGGDAYAARNLLWNVAGIAEALNHAGLDSIAAEALGGLPFPINATYFDKNAHANWKVPAHQDLMMPVERQIAEPGFGGWSIKLGIVYVEPPVDVLSRLVALRVHFDPCPASNGALAVVPGSHRRGKLRDEEIVAIAPSDFTTCEAAAGDLLLMKPLVVHRSSPALTPTHRRVLHIVYAKEQPGEMVRWRRSANAALGPPGCPPRGTGC